MPERIVDTPVDADVPDIPEILHQVLSWCLDDARQRMEAGEEITPFTALVAGDTLFTEEHVADEPDECYELACQTVAHAQGAATYVFCYDGYINLETEMLDAIVAEGGMPGEESGHAIGLVYSVGDDGTIEFAQDPVYLGEAPNFMAELDPNDIAADFESFDESQQAAQSAEADAAE